MLEWLKGNILGIYKWVQLKISNIGEWLQSIFVDVQEAVDFSSYIIGDQSFHSQSYAKMYDMSAKRKWQWLRNLVFLNKWSHSVKNEQNDHQILAQFSNKEALLAHTDLSFVRNPLPLIPGDAYINQAAFDEYLSHLAQYRHYHLFAQILFSMLRKNSVSVVDLLKNLIQARDQLHEKHFFDKNFTLLYVENKSQQWIASLIYRIFPKEPMEMIGLNKSQVLSPGHIGNGKNVLLCDDICYTGTQVIQMISSLAEYNRGMTLTLLFGRMSIYALSKVKERIKEIEVLNPGFKVNIVVGEFFHTVSAQLDFLPFRPAIKERHIIKQLLESDSCEQYRKGDFQRKPLLTTAWKKPDYVSSYYKFLGFEQDGPNPIGVSSDLLAKPPSAPVTLFSHVKPTPNVKVFTAFIRGPKPPYS